MSDLHTLMGLVERYSPSGEEERAVNWLVARMRALGFDKSFADEAGNAVGVLGDGRRQIVLLGHIDTVPGEIAVRVSTEGGREILHGRGTADAKGPLACFVDAVARLGARDGWQLVVIGAVDEERESRGARFVVERYRPDFAIIGEPNRWDRIALGYKGSAWAQATVRRPQAHSASGEQTAAEAAVEIWREISAFAAAYNADKKRVFDKILPTLRGISAEEDDFTQMAQMRIGARLPVDISPHGWYQRLENIAADSHASITRLGFPVPAWGCEKNSALVRAFLSGIRLEGGAPRFVYKTGTADLNIVAPVWNCPSAVYGPGDSALDHTPHEHIALDEYKKGVNVLANALNRLTDA